VRARDPALQAALEHQPEEGGMTRAIDPDLVRLIRALARRAARRDHAGSAGEDHCKVAAPLNHDRLKENAPEDPAPRCDVRAIFD
jgi:hypothetical protein